MKIYNLKNRIANNYLVGLDRVLAESKKTGGYVLIDTGYVEGYENFQQRLGETGVSPNDIKYVFLTHAHDDHAGFLNDVLAITDAKVILHPKAVERLLKGQNPFIGGCPNRQSWLFNQVLKFFGNGEHKYPPLKEEYLNRLVTIDSEEFQSISLPFKVIETPGHTADHIALMKDGILFCGDAAMNGFPSIRRVIIWIEDVEQYRQSWDKMIALNPTVIYPSHGKPFPTKDLVKYRSRLDSIRLYTL